MCRDKGVGEQETLTIPFTPLEFTCKFLTVFYKVGTIAWVGLFCGHVGSSLPAVPQARSNDASAQAAPEERTKRKRGQRQSKLVDVKGGMHTLSSLNFLVPEDQ